MRIDNQNEWLANHHQCKLSRWIHDDARLFELLKVWVWRICVRRQGLFLRLHEHYKGRGQLLLRSARVPSPKICPTTWLSLAHHWDRCPQNTREMSECQRHSGPQPRLLILSKCQTCQTLSWNFYQPHQLDTRSQLCLFKWHLSVWSPFYLTLKLQI